MAHTRHGHHIAGTEVGLPFLGLRARCGGVVICKECQKDAGIFHHPSNTNVRKKES